MTQRTKRLVALRRKRAALRLKRRRRFYRDTVVTLNGVRLEVDWGHKDGPTVTNWNAGDTRCPPEEG